MNVEIDDELDETGSYFQLDPPKSPRTARSGSASSSGVLLNAAALAAASSLKKADAAGTGLGTVAASHEFSFVVVILLVLLGAAIGWMLRGARDRVTKQLEDGKKEEERKPALKLKRALYGMADAAEHWESHVDRHLKAGGYVKMSPRGSPRLVMREREQVRDAPAVPAQQKTNGVWIPFGNSSTSAVYHTKAECGCRGAQMNELRVCKRCEREDRS